ncbi:MAG TPA: hypothetical protein VK961_02820 [Chthoniobacter sp.]|nr:hypothetical protein [Chthoniobacter sp.]
MTTAATPPPLAPEGAYWKGFTWIQIASILALAVIASVGGYSYFEYRSGATWNLPARYTFLPLFLVAYVLGSLLLIASSGPTNRLLRSFTLLVGFALSLWLMGEIDSRKRWYLRGLAHAAGHADLEPLRKWAKANAPAEGPIGNRVFIEDNFVPPEVRRTLPFKRGGTSFRFFCTSFENDFALCIVHAGGGFLPLNGVIVNVGKDFDPKVTGFLQVQRVSSDVWVFQGGG